MDLQSQKIALDHCWQAHQPSPHAGRARIVLFSSGQPATHLADPVRGLPGTGSSVCHVARGCSKAAMANRRYALDKVVDFMLVSYRFIFLIRLVDCGRAFTFDILSFSDTVALDSELLRQPRQSRSAFIRRMSLFHYATIAQYWPTKPRFRIGESPYFFYRGIPYDPPASCGRGLP